MIIDTPKMPTPIENSELVMLENIHYIQASVSHLPIPSTCLGSRIKENKASDMFICEIDELSRKRTVKQDLEEELFMLLNSFKTSAKVRSRSQLVHIYPNFCNCVQMGKRKLPDFYIA